MQRGQDLQRYLAIKEAFSLCGSGLSTCDLGEFAIELALVLLLNSDKEQTMDMAMLDSLKMRIDRLERQNRSVKRLTAVLFFVIIALVVTGIAVPRNVAKNIDAERFVLRDSNGQMRASLAFATKGVPALKFYDVNGNVAVVVGVVSDGGPMMAFHKDGKPRAWLRGGGQNPAFTLHDNMGDIRAILELDSKSGEPSLRLVNDKGYILTLGENDLVLNDRDEKIIWRARHNGIPVEDAKP